MIDYDKLGEQINAIEFDHAFTLHPDGSITDADDYAPMVYEGDGIEDIEIDSTAWRALTNLTGQYLYNGAVMHPSEYIGSGVARVMHDMTDWEDSDISHPVTFVVTTVIACDDVQSDYYDNNLTGWVILEKVA